MGLFGFGLHLAPMWFPVGVFWLAIPILWIWMLIDALLREEREYPGATVTSNNKLLWVLLLLFVHASAIVYLFVVYAKVKRGTVPAVTTAPAQPAA
jgi:hypothetical protein